MPTANLGDIAFGVVADTTRLTQALAQIRAFGNAVDAVAAAQAAAGKAMDAAWLKQESAIVRATVAQERFNATLQAASAPQALLNANTEAFNRLISNLSATGAPLEKLDMARSMEEFSSAMAKNRMEFAEWQETAKEGAGVGGKFTEAMEKIARAAQLITGPLSGAAFRITLVAEMMREGSLASTGLIAGFAGAAFAFTKLGESAIHAATQLVPIQNQIKAVSGSMMQTQLDMQFVMDTADRFGLKFQDAAKQFAGLATAARGTRLEGEGIREMFVQLAAVAGNLTLSEEKMAGMFQEVERLLSMGIVQWRNLRELSRDIPNIYELISKTIGTDTVAALEKFLRLGTQASDVLLPRLINQIVKAYGIDVAQRVDNISAAHERFNNALFRFAAAMDAAVGFSQRAISTYNVLRDALDALTNNLDRVAKIAVVAASAVAGLVAGYIIAGFGRLALAVVEVYKAMVTMNAVAAGSPITLLIKLAAAIAGAYVGYSYLDEALKKVNTSILTSTVDFQAYIDAWNKNKEGFSSNTRKMISDVEALKKATEAELQGTKGKLEDLEAQDKRLKEQLDKPVTGATAGYFASGAEAVRKNIQQTREQMDALLKVQTGQRGEAEKYLKLQLDLQKVLQQQIAAEKGRPGIKTGDLDAVIRMKEAHEKLETALEGVKGEWAAVAQGPYEVQKAFEEAKIEKQIQAMQQALEKAGYDWDRITKTFKDPTIDQEFKLWGEDLRKITDLKLFEKNFIEPWKVAEDLLKTGLTGAVDQVVSALQKGKVTWQDWSKVATDVISAVIKKLIELTVIIPTLNTLFGEGTAGRGLGIGGIATGGLIGGLIKFLSGESVLPGGAPEGTGGIGHAHGGTPISSFRFDLPSSLFAGAPRLHGGLGAGEYPAILQRGETVTPRGVSPGGSPVNINISHPPGTDADVQRDNTRGMDTYNIVITHVQKALSAGQLDLGMGGRFGFRPAGIRR